MVSQSYSINVAGHSPCAVICFWKTLSDSTRSKIPSVRKSNITVHYKRQQLIDSNALSETGMTTQASIVKLPTKINDRYNTYLLSSMTNSILVISVIFIAKYFVSEVRLSSSLNSANHVVSILSKPRVTIQSRPQRSSLLRMRALGNPDTKCFLIGLHKEQ